MSSFQMVESPVRLFRAGRAVLEVEPAPGDAALPVRAGVPAATGTHTRSLLPRHGDAALGRVPL